VPLALQAENFHTGYSFPRQTLPGIPIFTYELRANTGQTNRWTDKRMQTWARSIMWPIKTSLIPRNYRRAQTSVEGLCFIALSAWYCCHL